MPIIPPELDNVAIEIDAVCALKLCQVADDHNLKTTRDAIMFLLGFYEMSTKIFPGKNLSGD